MKIKAFFLSLVLSLSLAPTDIAAYTKNDLKLVQDCAVLAHLIGIITQNNKLGLTTYGVGTILTSALENECDNIAINLVFEIIFELAGLSSIHSYTQWLHRLNNQSALAPDKTTTLIARSLRTLSKSSLVSIIKNSPELKSKNLLRRTLRASSVSLSSAAVGLLETCAFNYVNPNTENIWKNFCMIAGIECAGLCMSELLGELALQGTKEAQLLRNKSQTPSLSSDSQQEGSAEKIE